MQTLKARSSTPTLQRRAAAVPSVRRAPLLVRAQAGEYAIAEQPTSARQHKPGSHIFSA
jgi:hypothetical protein